MTDSTIDVGLGTTLAPATTEHPTAQSAKPRTAPTQTARAGTAKPRTAKEWVRLLAPYRQQRHGRAAFELLVTLPPFVGLWLLMLWSLGVGYWLTLLLSLPAAGFLVRLFMIQHDCGHGSFFARRWANDALGRLLGVLTLTPYAYWRRNHAVHHATSGNLDRRGTGDIDTLTVREYQAMPRWRRALYRLSRHPVTILGIAPLWLFVARHRLPRDLWRAGGRQGWISVLGTNLAIGLVVAGLVALIGWQAFLAVQLPITVLGSTIGVWLFYVQHQFEETAWDADGEWDALEGALHGSSHYDLPAPLRWFTANIGIHHVHHLASRIPSYRLNEVLNNHPELREVSRLTLWQSLGCLRLALWDEDGRRLVRFRDVPATLPVAGMGPQSLGFSATT